MKIKPYVYKLSIFENKIQTIFDFEINRTVPRFSYPLTSDQYKIYIIIRDCKFLYIGTTKSSTRKRIQQGLSASGISGYHGYKWRKYKDVLLCVYCFEDYDKIKIESIEAELAFLVRKATGLWPECQNEIHFNNNYVPKGQLIAEKIYEQLNEILEKNNR